MSERYTRLFSLPENLYVEGSPVLIAAGALLRDNQTGGVLAQLKFQSLSERRIQAVKVALRAFDVTGAELEGVPEQQYLDLNVPRGDSFGQKTAIPLPNAVTRSFCCACSSVVFADGSVWTAPENAAWEPVKQPTPLQDALGDLAEQYRRDTFAGAQYAPADDRDLWVCACGTVNRRTEAQCVRCGSERDALFAAADATLLRERAQEFSAQQAKEAAERKAAAEKEAAEEKERMAAVKKRLIIAGSAAAVLIAAILVLTQVILPSCKYHAALKLMKNGSYDEAIAAFEALEDYKDSAAQAEACKNERDYQAAVAFMDAGRYEEAITAFEALGSYKDSAAQIEACTLSLKEPDYQTAVAFMDAGRYEEAITAFEALGSYKDSAAQIEACTLSLKEPDYQTAVAFMDAGRYEEAAAAFEALSNYKDSANKVAECYKQYYGDIYESIKNAVSGTTITFGTFEQDGDESNGAEPIEWNVYSVERDGNAVSAHLLSKYALFRSNLHDSDSQTYWKDTSDYRKLQEGMKSAFGKNVDKLHMEFDIPDTDIIKKYTFAKTCLAAPALIGEYSSRIKSDGSCHWITHDSDNPRGYELDYITWNGEQHSGYISDKIHSGGIFYGMRVDVTLYFSLS